jgi:hypothetical protein
LIDIVADKLRKLTAYRDQRLLAARPDEARNRLPLPLVFVCIHHVYAEVQGTRHLPITPGLPFVVKHKALSLVTLEGRISVRTE